MSSKLLERPSGKGFPRGISFLLNIDWSFSWSFASVRAIKKISSRLRTEYSEVPVSASQRKQRAASFLADSKS